MCDRGNCSKNIRPSRSFLAKSEVFAAQKSTLSQDRSGGYLKVDVTPPETFDGRKIWSSMLGPVRNQGNCGSCWSFASTDCLAMRIAIATNGHIKRRLSPAAMAICNTGSDYAYKDALSDMAHGYSFDFNRPEHRATARLNELAKAAELGCQGETLIGAWQYLYRFGVVEEKCTPYDGKYQAGADLGEFDDAKPNLPACSDVFGSFYDTCPTTGKPAVYHRASGYYFVPGVPKEGKTVFAAGEGDVSTMAELYGKVDESEQAGGSELDIRREIYHWGPVTSGFIIHDDFLSWDGKTGVYKWDGVSPEQGGHAIVIVGWGVTKEGQKYWSIKNSWGSEYGDGGYFKIARGSNECEIEENVVVGVPELPGYRLYLEHPLLVNEQDLFLRGAWNVTDSGVKKTTYDALLIGIFPVSDVDPDDNLFNTRYWPYLGNFIAGKPDQTYFPLNRNTLECLLRPRNRAERTTSHFVFGTVVVLTAAAGVYLYKRVK